MKKKFMQIQNFSIVLVTIICFVLLMGFKTSAGIFDFFEDKTNKKVSMPVATKVFLENCKAPITLNNGSIYMGDTPARCVRFELTNEKSDDYFVEIDITIKGQIDDGKGGKVPYNQAITNILSVAYANTTTKWTLQKLKNGIYYIGQTQFYGQNMDGSYIAQEVEINDIRMCKASEKGELFAGRDINGKQYYHTNGVNINN